MEKQITDGMSCAASKESDAFSGRVLGLGMPSPSPEVQAARPTTVGSPRSARGIANSMPSGAA